MRLVHDMLLALEADPSDDTAWLALADVYEECDLLGQAELVRLSLQIRRNVDRKLQPKRERRYRELLQQGAVVPLPRRQFRLSPRVEMEMVLLPPGSFWMGSPSMESRRDADEGPVHLVTLAQGVWMGVFPVTQRQWEALLGDPPGRFRGGNLPVDNVSWNDCQELLHALSARFNRSFRLPTEAEWEYACRAGTTTAFYAGDAITSDQANFDGNHPYGLAPFGPWLERTTPQGTYPPNAWGLFDMHGNVWEWCDDWYSEYSYVESPEINPIGPTKGTHRVLRGGSWYSYSWSCRSAGRERFAPENGQGNYGFRVALEHVPKRGG